MTLAGRVTELYRFPVKSMAGEPLTSADVSWNGLAGDRRWAFIQAGHERSGFPWLTIREQAVMAHYRPRLTDPDRPNGSLTMVRTPAGAELDVADAALAAELGPGVRVIKQDRGVFDTMPLSLLSRQALACLGKRIGAELIALRFRPNIVVDVPGQEYPEESWVGRVVRIGGVRMRVDQRDNRCVMITVDPVTLDRNPEVLRVVAQERDNQFGVYGSVVAPGRIAVGDPVEVEPA